MIWGYHYFWKHPPKMYWSKSGGSSVHRSLLWREFRYPQLHPSLPSKHQLVAVLGQMSNHQTSPPPLKSKTTCWAASISSVVWLWASKTCMIFQFPHQKKTCLLPSTILADHSRIHRRSTVEPAARKERGVGIWTCETQKCCVLT